MSNCQKDPAIKGADASAAHQSKDGRLCDLSERAFVHGKRTSLNETLTFSMVVQACLSGVVKQSGSGPPSRQIFDSISIRTVSPKPRGLVAWSEKYLEGNMMSRVRINDFSVGYCLERHG